MTDYPPTDCTSPRHPTEKDSELERLRAENRRLKKQLRLWENGRKTKAREGT